MMLVFVILLSVVPCIEEKVNANLTNKHATLVHEAGHAFSLAHCSHPGRNHIMHQGLKNYTGVSGYEKSELLRKWGR